MADARPVRHEPSDGVLRPRGATRLRGDDDEGPLPVARVVLYQAAGCTLCGDALAVLRDARSELGFELDVVDVDGDPELERRYRALLPVVEVDGEEAFVFEVDPGALRARLTA